ncbi:hypothetical protein [Enterobacter sp.]|uniref:hypothetical protein n=1 Tax=Enterobacter sp. TaxID=42895 RepID=UPI002075F050|nr:hypothetical protein [Enterobacter sp.]MCM7212232.1 hypothetical protein [Enterobacter hormaechei]MDU7340337.1 hypothetical protein [Enterobacter sp.]
MNFEPKIRTAKLIEENRTSLKLDESTWAAIDMLAEKRGTDWKGWAKMVLKANPDSLNKAALLRAALVEELMTEQMLTLAEAGPVETNINHEIIGNGYWRLNDEQLQSELDGATIVTRDNSFAAFTLLTGYRDKSYGGSPFVIIQNELRGQPHLMIAPDVD